MFRGIPRQTGVGVVRLNHAKNNPGHLLLMAIVYVWVIVFVEAMLWGGNVEVSTVTYDSQVVCVMYVVT